jgi:hypothetical protein
MNAVYLHLAEISYLYRIARHFRDDIEILKKVGFLLMREGTYMPAKRVFDRVLELDPTDPDANRYMLEEGKIDYVDGQDRIGDWPEGEPKGDRPKIRAGLRPRPAPPVDGPEGE